MPVWEVVNTELYQCYSLQRDNMFSDELAFDMNESFQNGILQRRVIMDATMANTCYLTATINTTRIQTKGRP